MKMKKMKISKVHVVITYNSVLAKFQSDCEDADEGERVVMMMMMMIVEMIDE